MGEQSSAKTSTVSDGVSGIAAGSTLGTVPWITATALVVADITSGFSLLLLWVVGGIVALCGVFCYAELATMLPRSSGEYNFLREIYHPAFGFVAGFLSATVGFAAPIALAAMAFGSYFQSIVPGVPALPLGLAITWLAALVHLFGVRFGGAYHNLWTALKLAFVVVFIIAGFAFGDVQPISFAPSAADLVHITGAPFAGKYSVSSPNAPQVSVPGCTSLGWLRLRHSAGSPAFDSTSTRCR